MNKYEAEQIRIGIRLAIATGPFGRLVVNNENAFSKLAMCAFDSYRSRRGWQ